MEDYKNTALYKQLEKEVNNAAEKINKKLENQKKIVKTSARIYEGTFGYGIHLKETVITKRKTRHNEFHILPFDTFKEAENYCKTKQYELGKNA